MFKYMIVLAFALVAVMAAPPAAPEAPNDLKTANQLLYGYGGYPSVYSAGYGGYPGYASYGYAAYPAYNTYGYRVVG